MSYPQASVSPLTRVDTTQLNPIGTLRREGLKEYIYLKGVASLAATDFVVYHEDGATVRLVTGTPAGPVAVALAAVLSGQFGWFQIEGPVSGNVAASFADNGLVFSTATAGRADDAIVADSQVLGAVGRSIEASNVATIQLNRPWFGDTNGA